MKKIEYFIDPKHPIIHTGIVRFSIISFISYLNRHKLVAFELSFVASALCVVLDSNVHHLKCQKYKATVQNLDSTPKNFATRFLRPMEKHCSPTYVACQL